MTERPILFSGAMVRAILEGRKTVTRRVVKPAPHGDLKWNQQILGKHVTNWTDDLRLYECPYGQPGDRLWVRESLRYDPEYGHFFAAGGRHGETVYLCSLFDDKESQTGYSYDGLLPERSVPSIHLHRRYSRILLEVTDARVERLQDISEEQALAEGLARVTKDGALFKHGIPERDGLPGTADSAWPWQEWEADPRKAFAKLWTGINGTESWDANPWVWVVEFKRVTP